MGKKNKQRPLNTVAQYFNDISFLYYYNWLKLIALNVYKWENVPSSIDVRYLELTLFERGIAVYFNDIALGNIALPVNLSGQYDVYGIPQNYYAYSSASNYKNRELDNKNSVLIFNDYLFQPTENIVQLYANKLYELDRTIDVNVKAQKTPILVKSSEQQKLTMLNMINQYDGNEPFLYVADTYSGSGSGIEVFETKAPFVCDKLEVLKHNILNDFLTAIGVENSNNDKKERLVSDEIGSNYGLIEVSRNVRLNPRKEAVKKINEMFGTNIEVSFNSDVQTLVNNSNIGGGFIE